MAARKSTSKSPPKPAPDGRVRRKVHLTLDPALLARIDRHRGKRITRSRWIEDAALRILDE